tara:strand:- start:486 stop:827 length:342 start_codon:yes stop_codon:yes gene_type:complete
MDEKDDDWKINDDDSLIMKGDSLEARATLFALAVKIQSQFWREFQFKFQVGWVCAGLLDDEDFAIGITKARHVINSEGLDASEDFFTELWEQYLIGMGQGTFRDWKTQPEDME